MRKELFPVCAMILTIVVSGFAQNESQKATAYNSQGVTQFEAEKYEAAVESFNQAIAQKSDYGTAYYNLGTAYSRLKQFENAEDSLQKAIKFSPRCAEAYYQLGVVYIET